MNTVSTKLCISCSSSNSSSNNLTKHSRYTRKDGTAVQRYICTACNTARIRAKRGSSAPIERKAYQPMYEVVEEVYTEEI